MATKTKNTMGASEAPRECPVGTIFAPYFNARFQNFQNIVNRSDFYAQMPTEWLTYQNTYVRQWDEWSCGFVPALHRGDFFATGMGKTVVDVLVRECMRGGYRFDSKDEVASAAVTTWAKDNDIDGIIRNGFEYANALGNAIVRLNLNATTLEIFPTVHPVNRCYFQINRKGKVIRARFIDMLGSGTTKDAKYYTIEDRVWLNNAAWYRVSVFRFSGQANMPMFTEAHGLDDLDVWAKSLFGDVYGDIAIKRWYRLPFKRSLGAYNWKNTAASLAISEMDGYADSSLHTALDILYAIDYNYSMGQLDQYFGRTRVLIPRELQIAPQRVISNGVDYGEMQRFIEAPPLKETIFTEVPSSSTLDRPAQPTFIQPELRGDIRKQLNDHYLELLASKVGLSSSTLANHLTYNQSKTATEVTTEKDTTDVTVGHKRDLANTAIDEMLKDVCDFMGITADVDITWNYSGNNNKEQVLSEYQRNVMPLRECVKRLHPELTEAEVDKWVEELKVEQPQGDNTNLNNIFGIGDEY